MTQKYDLKTVQSVVKLVLSQVDSGYYSAKKITDPALKKLAEDMPSTPGSLDVADFYYLLSKPDLILPADRAACVAELMKALYLPAMGEGDDLSVEMTPLGGGAFAAVVRIKPKGYDPKLLPDVQIGGVSHPAGVYADDMDEMRAEGRERIFVDSAGVGGSRAPLDGRVDKNLIVKLAGVVENLGKVRWLQGHSYGAWIVKHLMLKHHDSGKYMADLYIPQMPVPGALEERAGLKLNPRFAWGAIKDMLLNGGVPAPGWFRRACFEKHTPAEQKELGKVTAREMVVTNPVRFTGAFWEADDWSKFLDLAGRDPHLLIVLAKDDKIVKLKNPDEWKRRGILILDGVDHSCIAGRESGSKCRKKLREMIAERRDLKLLPPDVNEMVRSAASASLGFRQETHVPLQYEKPEAYAGIEARLKIGLHRNLDLQAGVSVLGGGNGEHHGVPLWVDMDIMAIPGSATHWSVGAGARAGMDFLNVRHLPPSVHAKAEYKFFVANFGASLLYFPSSDDDFKKRFALLFNISVPVLE